MTNLSTVFGLEKKEQIKEVDLSRFEGEEMAIFNHGEEVGGVHEYNKLVSEVAKFEMNKNKIAEVILELWTKYDRMNVQLTSREEAVGIATEILSKSSSWIVRKG